MRKKAGLGALFLLLAVPVAVQGALLGLAGKEKPPKSSDPYGTAERETGLPLAASDLAYSVVVFDAFEVPENLKKNAKYIAQTEEQAIARLRGTNAFTSVDRKADAPPEGPYLLVKCVVLDHRIVGGKTRFFTGALSGSSHITYEVKLLDGQTGDLLHDTKLSTENNAFVGAWTGNDKGLPHFMGNAIGDYVALRARTDKGLSVIPPSWPAK
jgi:hypothetical protein